MQIGLTSVTFRLLCPEEIVRLAVGHGLECIEWGGDVHCPPGNRSLAWDIGRLTAKHGLSVSSYGSYYRTDPSQTDYTFRDVLDTALALGTNLIRLWAGTLPSRQTSHEQRRSLVKHARWCAQAAAEAGCRIAFEYHRNTLTDTHRSALALMQEIDHPACRLYWQANYETSFEENLEAIRMVGPYVVCAHVFAWDKGFVPLLLQERQQQWRQFYQALPDRDNMSFLLEFVKNNSAESFAADCLCLKEIVSHA